MIKLGGVDLPEVAQLPSGIVRIHIQTFLHWEHELLSCLQLIARWPWTYPCVTFKS